MTYETAQALRTAVEYRLRNQSEATGISLDRLRRRVVFERVVARLHAAEPGRWVLKGGMALEVRLGGRARLTKDIDLGLRDLLPDAGSLHERLVEALSADPFEDYFILTVPPLAPLQEDGGGFLTWRTTVEASLAGRVFGRVKVDISPREHELESTDRIPLPNSLAFAGISVPAIEIIDVQRHAAEKLHAIQRQYGDRENSRVRDLVDLVILNESDLLDRGRLSVEVRNVWREREQADPPTGRPTIPAGWHDRYEQLAEENDLQTQTFAAAVDFVDTLWLHLTTTEEH